MSQGSTRAEEPGRPKVRLEIADGIAQLVLDRPDKLNVLDQACLDLIRAHLTALDLDPSVRALVVRGEGRGFCAGADLGSVSDLIADRAAFDAFLDRWHATLDAIESCPVPTIAAVHGMALAGGFELLHVCDLVVLADDATIGDQHATFGLYPAGGGTHRLGRLIGPRRASWLLMSGASVAPSDALAWGLVNEVVPASEVLATALEMADRVSRNKSGNLNTALKDALREGSGLSLHQALDAERPRALDHQTSTDAGIGIAAFRARTVPEFPLRTVRRPVGATDQEPSTSTRTAEAQGI